MSCKLCGCEDIVYRDGEVRDSKELKIIECPSCGLVYLSDTKHIDEEFYKKSSMHKEIDFRKWQRDTTADDSRRYSFLRSMITNKDVLDFGSGNGGFCLKAKEIVSEINAVELEKAVEFFYKQNNIPLYNDLTKVQKKFDVITAFHVLEHLQDPEQILQNMKELLKERGKIIIEVPNSEDALLTLYESEAFSKFTYWSCHLYLYNQHTITLLAKQAGLRVEFIKHIQRYPLSNHLYWLSKNKPGGHSQWGSFLDSPELTHAYENQLASIGATDTLLVSLVKE